MHLFGFNFHNKENLKKLVTTNDLQIHHSIPEELFHPVERTGVHTRLCGCLKEATFYSYLPTCKSRLTLLQLTQAVEEDCVGSR